MKNWVKEVFDYRDGALYWRKQPKMARNLDISKPAGSLTGIRGRGYWQVCYKQKHYQRSHLVFYWHNGRWPEPQCDHINRIRHDDRIENLRAVTQSDNNKNTKSKGKVPFKYIIKEKCKCCKQGFIYGFIVCENGKINRKKRSVNLERLVRYRDNWLFHNRPDLYKYCKPLGGV